ncbi:MAG: hypothetical protein ACR2LX_17740 [Jatrophihabitans sp.]
MEARLGVVSFVLKGVGEFGLDGSELVVGFGLGGGDALLGGGAFLMEYLREFGLGGAQLLGGIFLAALQGFDALAGIGAFLFEGLGELGLLELEATLELSGPLICGRVDCDDLLTSSGRRSLGVSDLSFQGCDPRGVGFGSPRTGLGQLGCGSRLQCCVICAVLRFDRQQLRGVRAFLCVCGLRERQIGPLHLGVGPCSFRISRFERCLHSLIDFAALNLQSLDELGALVVELALQRVGVRLQYVGPFHQRLGQSGRPLFGVVPGGLRDGDSLSGRSFVVGEPIGELFELGLRVSQALPQFVDVVIVGRRSRLAPRLPILFGCKRARGMRCGLFLCDAHPVFSGRLDRRQSGRRFGALRFECGRRFGLLRFECGRGLVVPLPALSLEVRASRLEFRALRLELGALRLELGVLGVVVRASRCELRALRLDIRLPRRDLRPLRLEFRSQRGGAVIGGTSETAATPGRGGRRPRLFRGARRWFGVTAEFRRERAQDGPRVRRTEPAVPERRMFRVGDTVLGPFARFAGAGTGTSSAPAQPWSRRIERDVWTTFFGERVGSTGFVRARPTAAGVTGSGVRITCRWFSR